MSLIFKCDKLKRLFRSKVAVQAQISWHQDAKPPDFLDKHGRNHSPLVSGATYKYQPGSCRHTKVPQVQIVPFFSNMYQHKTKMAFAIYLNSNCIFYVPTENTVYVPTKKLSIFSTYFLYMCDQKKSTGFNCHNLVTQWLRFSSKNLGNMGEYESLWKSMKVYENLWTSMKISDFHQNYH